MSVKLEESLINLVELKPSWRPETVEENVNCVLECYISDLESEDDIKIQRADSNYVEAEPIRLISPTLTTNQEDEKALPPCLIKLSCSGGRAFQTLLVESDSKHIELYNHGSNAYLTTLKGEVIDTSHHGSNTSNNALVFYQHHTTFQQNVRKLEIKFICGKNKFQLALKKIRLGMKILEEGNNINESGLASSQSIDMESVKQMLSSKEFSLPEQANSLMASIEQYQKNQTLALADIQGLIKSIPPANNTPASLSGYGASAGILGSMHLLGMGSKFVGAAGGGEGSDPAPMMNLLQRVCSDMGKIRQDKLEKEKEATTLVSSEQDKQQQQEFKNENDIPKQIQEMESRLAAMIVESENRIIRHMETRLSQLQVTLMDTIMKQITTILVPDKNK